MLLYRYGRWDGTQELFLPDSNDLMNELADELTSHGDVQRALRELFNRGMKNQQGQRTMGMREMMERLRNRRKDQLQKHNLDSILDDLKKMLEDVVKTEREGIDRRVQEAQGRMQPQGQQDGESGQPAGQDQSEGGQDEGQQGNGHGQRELSGSSSRPSAQSGTQQGQHGQQGQSGQPQPGRQGQTPGQTLQEKLLERLQQRAQQSKEKLDSLPKSLAGAVNELSGYEFMEPEAQRKFQELMDLLKSRMMDSMFNNMRQMLQNLTPEQKERLRQMMRELNKMLQQKAKGQEPDFGQFMQQFGGMFGDNPPQSLDDLLQQMAQQMGNMQSLMNSLSPQQRRELEDLMEQALDPETRAEMEELAATLREFMPFDTEGSEYKFEGRENLDYDQAQEMMGQLRRMDELEEQLRDIQRKGNIDDINPDELEKLLGEDARRHLEALQELAKKLEEAGYVQRKGEKLELTPRGIRKIGQKALMELFKELQKERAGRHDLPQRGAGGDNTGTTKPFQFGDSFDLALEKTVFNAVIRTGPSKPVRLAPNDFEVFQTETITQSATCILLDQSRSMGLFGSFQAAKKVTLALQTLIQTHFARDVLYVIGFSDYAVEIKPEEIPQVSWNAWVSGTNMHHALMLSRKFLRKHRGATRQILMITDGEPTAHLEGTRAYFNYPPSYRTLSETLKEVRKCTQEGITINTFMLENNYDLLDFVDKMTKINRGRAFYSTPDNLGQYVLVDYVKNRRKRVA
jgi:uncharacterized protein with von Willebrand factor type A (vWA) domain